MQIDFSFATFQVTWLNDLLFKYISTQARRIEWKSLSNDYRAININLHLIMAKIWEFPFGETRWVVISKNNIHILPYHSIKGWSPCTKSYDNWQRLFLGLFAWSEFKFYISIGNFDVSLYIYGPMVCLEFSRCFKMLFQANYELVTLMKMFRP